MENQPKPFLSRWWVKIIGLILFVLLILGIIIAVYTVSYLRSTIGSSQTKVETTVAIDPRILGSGQNFSTGPSDPLITIVEFADFGCPICARTFSTIREIGTKYSDRVKIIFRNYPVITENSVDLALAAHCAGAQGKFWEMHDALYLYQGITSREDIVALAERIGVDRNELIDCLDAQTYLPLISADAADAEALGITGTPTWFINGRRLSGDVPRTYFLNIIDEMLQSSPR